MDKHLAYIQFLFSLPAAFVSLSVVSFCIYKFFLHKNEHYFAKRHPALTTAELFISVILVLLQPVSSYFHSKSACRTPTKVRSVVSSIFSLLWLWVVLMRLFLLNFDHHYCQALSSQKWRHQIDPDEVNTWLAHKRTWGNPTWLLKISLLFLIPFGSVLAYLSFGHEETILVSLEPIDVAYFAVVYSSLFVCVAVVTWVYCRLPAASDSLHIRSEIRLCVLLFLVAMISTLVIDSIPQSLTRSILYTLVWTVGLSCWCFVSTLYVIRMNSPKDDVLSTCFPLRVCCAVKQDGVRFSGTLERLASWQKIARNPEGFEMFTNFLCSEFAVENILFITEWMQFKYHNEESLSGISLACEEDSEDSFSELSQRLTSERQRTFSIELPLEALPFSKKVSNAHPSILGHAYYLFAKYIEPGAAPLEINIDYETRYQLINIFTPRRESILQSYSSHSDSYMVQMTRMTSKSMSNTLLTAADRLESSGADIGEVAALFEQCGAQVSVLLRSSFSRFCLTKEYQILCQKYPELKHSPLLPPMSPGQRMLTSLLSLGEVRL